MSLKRIGIVMFVVGFLVVASETVGVRIAESNGYHDLIDNELWFPIRMVFTLSLAFAVGGVGILVLLRVIGEN